MLPDHRIPLAIPDVGEDERRLVDEVLQSPMLSLGPMLRRFEEEMADRFRARHAIGVSSGTAGLHLGMIAAGVQAGDLVITSPFSFVASANAILYERGVPIFVDVDPVTLTIDPARALDALDTLVHRRAGWRHLLPRTGVSADAVLRAVLPVHLFGRPAEMRELLDASREAGVAVVEDACEAIGATSDGVPAGRWGDAGVFGFFPNKQITTGEGGMILTDDDGWARTFRSLRNQGRGDGATRFVHERLGYNYRLDEMSAALGVGQLRRLDDLLRGRAAVARRYNERLSTVAGVTPMAEPRPGMTLSWFLYPVRLAPDLDRSRLIARLAARGIESRPYFWPIHLEPFYRERFGFQPGDFPACEAAGASLLALPMAATLSDADIDRVCSALETEVAHDRARRAPAAMSFPAPPAA